MLSDVLWPVRSSLLGASIYLGKHAKHAEMCFCCSSVRPSVTVLHPAKVVGQNEMQFDSNARVAFPK